MFAHQNSRPNTRHSRESGYVLLSLLLVIALMIIVAAAIVPSISFDIKRDREDEMIHRGVQYSRAIRAYYKKFGRYPMKIEDLESANNLRFLRKRYKDPITGQDFKLLHFGDVKLTFSGGMIGGTIPGAGPMNGAPGMNPTTGNFGQTSTFGAGNAAYGTNQTTAVGLNPQGANNSGSSADSTGSTPSSTNSDGQSDSSNPQSSGGDQLSKTTFGGGPIVGVVSSSKKDTIREFNHKKKYNEWQFIYDPGTDRGGLLMTPNQPPLLGMGQSNGALAPQNGLAGGNPLSNGVQNNPTSPSTGDLNTPSQPTNPPQQQ